MVTSDQIKDEETLWAWLKGRSQSDAVAFAHRVALRVFPLWAAEMDQDWARKRELTSLPFLRIHLTVGVYIGDPTPTVKTATAAASAAAADSAFSAASAAATASAAFSAFSAASAAAAFSAAFSAASAAAAFSAAFSAASAAATDSAAFSAVWDTVRSDARFIEAGRDCRAEPLWPRAAPKALAAAETAFLALWDREPEVWDFWRRLWEGARDGRPLDWELQKRVALIPPEDWDKNDPAHIARLISEIEAEFAKGTALSRATPLDFTFDTMARIMRMVGLDDDAAHLRDPAIVQAFLDDCEELRDTFNDFMDYARELGGMPNRAGVLRRAAEKVCSELDRTRNRTHLRARYLVKLGNELELFAKEERARDDLGPVLAGMLDNATGAVSANRVGSHFVLMHQ